MRIRNAFWYRQNNLFIISDCRLPNGMYLAIFLKSLYINSVSFFFTQQYPEQHRKFIYCSRTVPEIDKALAELKNLMAYREKCGLVEDFFGVGLTSRKNLCLNPTVAKEKKGKVVDSKCRNLTASWVRAKAAKSKASVQDDDAMEVDDQVQLCNFYEVIFFIRTSYIRIRCY